LAVCRSVRHHSFRNVYGYVGQCWGAGNNLAFYDNQCITTGGGFSCPTNPTMTVKNNTVYCNGGNCKQCKGMVKPLPSDANVNAMGAAAIAPFPLPSTIDTSK
jgi:hypothetical protein